MKAILLLALAAVGQCALLGSKKCTYGPSYWCSHIQHARECSAMQHCMTTVWKNQRMDMIGSAETCFDVMKVLDVVRHTNDEDFMEQWTVGCTGMPADKRQLCKDLIGTNMKEVSMLLKSDLSSRQIAAALKLCGGFVDSVQRPEEVQVTGDYCKDCTNFFGDLRELFNNSEGQAAALVKSEVCSRLGALASVCDQFVDQYLNVAFNLIYQQLNPQDICQALRMCDNQAHAELMKSFKYMLAKKQRSAAGCDVCKTVAKGMQDILGDETFQTDLVSALETDVCPLLGSFATQCKSYVQQYAPLVFQIAVAELDPPTFCKTVGLCNGTKSDSSKLTHVSLASPAGAVHILAPKKEKSSMECFLCKYLVKELKEEMEGKTEEELEAELEKLCEDLPDEISGTCTKYVEEYGPEVIKLLMDKVDPDTVCKALNVCASAKLMSAVKVDAAPKASAECEVCLWTMKIVRAELNSSTARTEGKDLLDKICNLIPSGYKDLCVEFINGYYPAIINMVLEDIDPTKLCSLVKLCGSAVDSANHALKFQPMMTLQPAAKHYMLGTNKCLFGPSFWCASPENMKMCQAEEHCKEMKENNTEG